MRKDDISIGGEYVVFGGHHGKAIVTGPERYKWGAYYWPVSFPETPNPPCGEVASRDITRRWGNEDQARFEEAQRISLANRAVRDRLIAAGYEMGAVGVVPQGGRDWPQRLHLTFLGDSGGRAVEALLADRPEVTSELEVGDGES